MSACYFNKTCEPKGFKKAYRFYFMDVEDLDAVEAKVRAAGLEPFGHEEYDPGKRFYFFDWNGIEFEVVNYG